VRNLTHGYTVSHSDTFNGMFSTFLQDASVLRKKQQELLNALGTLDAGITRVEQPALIRLSDAAFVPGVIYHTNEVLCPPLHGLAAEWSTVQQARERIATMLRTLEADIDSLASKCADGFFDESHKSLLASTCEISQAPCAYSAAPGVGGAGFAGVREIEVDGQLFSEIVETFAEDDLPPRHRAILQDRARLYGTISASGHIGASQSSSVADPFVPLAVASEISPSCGPPMPFSQRIVERDSVGTLPGPDTQSVSTASFQPPDKRLSRFRQARLAAASK
jgi:hypothetical protein